METPVRFCGSCGTKLTSDSLFCPECGTRQDGTVPSGTNQQLNQTQQANTPNAQTPYQQPAQASFQQSAQPQYQQPYQQAYQQQNQQPNQQQYQQSFQQPNQQQYQQSFQQPNQQAYHQQYQQPNHQQYQQSFQQPNQQAYQQNFNQPYNSNQYYNTPKKKGSGGVIVAILIIALAFVGGYFGYNKLFKGKVPLLDRIASGGLQAVAGQNNLAGLSEDEVNEILQMRPDAMIGTWEGTLTFEKVQGMENEKDFSEEDKKMLEGMLGKPMKLIYYFKGRGDELVASGILTYPEMGDNEIDEMPYSLAAGQFSMKADDGEAVVDFSGALGKKDGALYIDGSFKIDVMGTGNQYIEGKWEIKQISNTLPAE